MPAVFTLTASVSQSGIPRGSVTKLETEADGRYTAILSDNTYQVAFATGDGDATNIGIARVSDGPPIGLFDLLAEMGCGADPVPPPAGAVGLVPLYVTPLSTDHTAVIADSNTLFVCDQALTFTLPADLPSGFRVSVLQSALGPVTLTAGIGASIALADPFVARTRVKNSVVTATRLLDVDDTWLITGDCYDAYV